VEKLTVWNLFKYRKAAALTTAMRSVKGLSRDFPENSISTKKRLHLTLLRGTEFYFTLKLKGVTDEEIITLIKAMKASTTRPTSYEEVLELACKGSVVIK